jgi:hypothetical protein
MRFLLKRFGIFAVAGTRGQFENKYEVGLRCCKPLLSNVAKAVTEIINQFVTVMCNM